jgi:tRNA nucleotidyltransferase (CCA-adding enzyme)
MKVKDVLKKQIERSLPELAILKKIEEVSKKYVEELGKKLSAKKISGEVFVGGRVAKKTITKKKKYDVDVFVRFSEEYREKDLSKLLGKVMNRKAKKIPRFSRLYQEIIEEIVLEIIPVLKISKPEEMENVTDLSYFHVNYILGN